MSKSYKGYGNHFLVAGVAALVASSIVALGSLSRAEVTAEQRASCEASCREDTNPDMPPPEQRDCATWCEDLDYKGGPAPSGDATPAPMQCPPNPNPPEVPAKCGSETGYQWQTDPNWRPSPPAPSSQTSPQWGEDRCSQIHSAKWGDRCAKEQALLQSGCVQGISPECGGQSPQQGQQQGMGKTIEIKNDIATCYADDGRWTQDQECQHAAQKRGLIRGQQRNVPQQQWDDGGRMGGAQMMKCDSRNPPPPSECPNAFCTNDGRWECGGRGGQMHQAGMMPGGKGGFMGGPGMGGPGMMGPGGFGPGGGMGGPGGEELEMMVAKITRSPIAIKMFTKKVMSSIKRESYSGVGELTAWQAMLETIQENVQAVIDKYATTKPSIAKKYRNVLPAVDKAVSAVGQELETAGAEEDDMF